MDVYVQVSHDGGANWKDVAHFAPLTTTSVRSIWRTNSADSVLDADAQNPAPFASWWRVKYVVVGAYANTQLRLDVIGATLAQAGPVG